MDTKWLIALSAIVISLIVGIIASRVIRVMMSKENRPEVVQAVAKAVASLVFSVCLIIGLVIALGVVNETALEQLPKDVVAYIPRVLSAAIVLIGANILGAIVTTILEQSLGHVSTTMRRRVPAIARGLITAFAVLIAASQIGIDTQILTLLVASIFFSIGLAAALVAGLGARDVAAELAAGRAVKRLLQPGDLVAYNDTAGRVINMHSVGLEIETGEGQTIVVPHSDLLSEAIHISRSEPIIDDRSNGDEASDGQ